MTIADRRVAHCPGESVQDVLARDVAPAQPHYRREDWTYQGAGDIDRERYWSPEWHALEVQGVWKKVWQIACREEDIPEVGDHVVYDIVDDSLIVVRSGPGVIKAFHNSCLHRGITLRQEGGRVPRFVCPFHGFTFSLGGALTDVPAAWDFPQIHQRDWCLPQAHVACWGGFVFVNLDADPEPLLDYLEVLPSEFAFRPLDERWTSAHVQRVVPCNWKIALEAFAEAYHVVRTHPQALPFNGDANSQYDVGDGVRHVSRMINLLGIPSPHLQDPDLGFIDRALAIREFPEVRPEHLSARQFAAQQHRRHYEQRFGADLSTYSDVEILDAVQYHVFPNWSPWAGIGQPLQYLWRPNGNDPGSSIMEVRMLSPLPTSGERPTPAPLRVLEPDEPWTNAKELGKYAPVFQQDMGNFARLQRGMKVGRKGNSYSVYQESKIRHFHCTLDHYVGVRPFDSEPG